MLWLLLLLRCLAKEIHHDIRNKSHDVLRGVSIRFFNCMCKNLQREMNEFETKKAARKIRKLTGKNATN